MSTELLTLAEVALPQIVLGTGICAVLLAGVFSASRAASVTYVLGLLTLLATGWATGSGAADPVATPGGAALIDPLARLLILLSLAVGAIVFVYGRSFLRARPESASNFHLLALFALLGIVVMITAGSFLSMYLGLEILSLALYAMAASERDSPLGAEAAMKYFVLGAIASGSLLYGISIIYGVTGSIGFSEIAATLTASGERGTAVVIGLVFVLTGIAFKFGAVPFHMWLPDVYHGAPANVTLFIATAPKLAAFALALRVLVEGLGPAQDEWRLVLAVLAVLSLGIGNIVAIVQTNLKRMLAYSTIAHVGFILLGFVAGDPQGIEAALFYTVIYVLMTAGAFGLILLMSGAGTEMAELDDLKGLNRRSPWFAAVMLLLMVSMIGVPPLAGFYAKWWILSALLDAGYLWLAIAGVFFSVIGAFYYLRVIKLMYFDDEPVRPSQLSGALDLRVLLSLNGALVLGLGIFPSRLMEICARVLI